MTTRIRRGVATDARALAELAAITFPLATPSDTDPAAIVEFIREQLSAARFSGYLDDPTRVVLVGEVDDRLVGYTMLIVADPDDPEVAAAVTARPTAELSKCYVHPDVHGSGTANELMDASIDAARTAGAVTLWLGVNNENERANRFYEKHGFAVVGTKHFLLGERLEDDYVRERIL